MSKKMWRSGEGVSEKGKGAGEKWNPSLALTPPSAPFFSHFLSLSFPIWFHLLSTLMRFHSQTHIFVAFLPITHTETTEYTYVDVNILRFVGGIIEGII